MRHLASSHPLLSATTALMAGCGGSSNPASLPNETAGASRAAGEFDRSFAHRRHTPPMPPPIRRRWSPPPTAHEHAPADGSPSPLKRPSPAVPDPNS